MINNFSLTGVASIQCTWFNK